MRILIAQACLLAACAGPPALRTNPGDPLAPLAWMAAAWSSEDDEGHTIELWLPPEGGTMIGVSRTAHEGRTVFHEAMRLEVRDDAIVYVASPSGQETAEFTLVQREGTRAVFENLAHDYPQRIVYERTGDRLIARIEDASGERTSSWTFTRSLLP